ncbi:MAG TPA: hypothetical protein VK002_15705 [Rubricoccaceae bacterium]|nr:hypothetical protein [Rubricoccaceae bacterium]
MNTIPAGTHAAELAATVDDLERGLLQLPLAKAVNRIDDWRREIAATEREDLRPIADGLKELHGLLAGEDRDGAAIGDLLVRLGEQTEAAADGADERLRNGLKRLGSLLRHAGSALASNARHAAAQGTPPAGSDPGPDTAGSDRPSALPS